jgi:hypothetical protein
MMKETDVAAAVVRLLQDDDFDVYQEVVMPHGGRADIVGMRGEVGYLIEAKMNLGFDVLAQAYESRFYAEFVSVAVPSGKQNRARGMAIRWATDHGIGIIEVAPAYGGKPQAIWRAEPRYTRYGGASLRVPRTRLRDIVEPEHKTALAAGGNGGGYHTPYKRTCLEVLRVVTERPGLTPKEVIAAVERVHWARRSAGASLIGCVERGIVPGVRLERTESGIRLYPIQERKALIA